MRNALSLLLCLGLPMPLSAGSSGRSQRPVFSQPPSESPIPAAGKTAGINAPAKMPARSAVEGAAALSAPPAVHEPQAAEAAPEPGLTELRIMGTLSVSNGSASAEHALDPGAVYDHRAGLLDGESMVLVPSYFYGAPGGVTNFTRQWMNALLCRNKLTLHVVQVMSEPRKEETQSIGLGSLHNVPVHYDGPGRDFAVWEPLLRGALSAVTRAVHPKLIMLQTPLENVARAAADVAQEERAATMILLHSLMPHFSTEETMRSFSRLDARTGVSRFVASRVRPEATVLGPVLDLKFWDPAAIDMAAAREDIRARFALESSFVLLAPHRIAAIKGQLDAVKALAVLNQGAARPYKLVLAGDLGHKDSGKNYEREVRDYARGHGLEDQILWLPFQDEKSLRDWYAASDLVLVPTRGEPLGLVALEAQAMGVPVAGYREGGIPETVEDGKTALLADAGDPESLAAAIDKMRTDRTFYSQARRQARAFVLREYDPIVMLARHESLYRRLMDHVP